MKPVIVLVGRPNVGKSTLFNRLVRGRRAIVADEPGVTRDRAYAEARLGGRDFLLVDTGGLVPGEPQGLYGAMARQTERAIAEADAIVFLVDARAGLTAADREIADRLRREARRVWLAVNKAEGLAPGVAAAEFHALGLGVPHPVSAEHGEGVRELFEAVLGELPALPAPEGPAQKEKIPRVAIVGRPNAGKSTLVNALVGEERVVAHPEPGTTRDAVEVPFERAGRRYVLVDTAGLRRRARIEQGVEAFSVVRTLRAIELADVAVLLIDATAGVTDQDAHIAGHLYERGRAVVVAVNKWDAVDREARARLRAELSARLGFLAFAETHFVSALLARGLGPLLAAVDRAHASATAKLPTPRLTRVLQAAVERQAPPRARGRVRPKLRYAHQGGSTPPRIVIHGNALEHLSESYRRYLEGRFREAFGLRGTPIRIELRTGPNPFAGRRARS